MSKFIVLITISICLYAVVNGGLVWGPGYGGSRASQPPPPSDASFSPSGMPSDMPSDMPPSDMPSDAPIAFDVDHSAMMSRFPDGSRFPSGSPSPSPTTTA